MKDIARDLGVSVATVSRALKDSSRISTAQKERIQKYAREHNFFPNFLGEALRHNKVKPMKVIGVIVPQVVHYYFMSVLSGIEEEARARGYRVMVAQSNERYDKEVAICEDFYQNKVCGIIVSQAKDTKQYDHFEKLLQNGVPLIFYDRICTGVNCSRVVVDDYMGAFTAVTHMIDTGCKKIAFYGSPMNMEISKNRYNGYHDALVKHGLTENPNWVKVCDNRAQAEAITPEILELAELCNSANEIDKELEASNKQLDIAYRNSQINLNNAKAKSMLNKNDIDLQRAYSSAVIAKENIINKQQQAMLKAGKGA